MMIPRPVQLPHVVVILGLALGGSGPTFAQELDVTPTNDPGVFSVDLGTGETAALEFSVEGPPPPESQGNDNCRYRKGHFLNVLLRTRSAEQQSIAVPLDTPGEIGEVRVLMRSSSIVLALSMYYECYHWRGESEERRWIAIEFAKEPRLLLNSAVGQGGRICFPGDLRSPKRRLEPDWIVEDGRLWMKLGVRTWLCYSDAKEDRGHVMWQAGEEAQPVRFSFPRHVQRVVPEIQSYGSQPYTSFRFGRGLVGLLAEHPRAMGGARLVVIADRHGRVGMIHLPQFGYGYLPMLRGEPVDRSAAGLGRENRYRPWEEKEWPQLGAVQAFEYSESFLRARRGVTAAVLLRNRTTTVSELVLPCVEATNPAPTGVENERWLVRVERVDEELKVESALIEPCSFGPIGINADLYRLPPGNLEVRKNSVRLSFSPPEIDFEVVADDKFLFDNYWDLVHNSSISSMEMSLDAPTKTIPRCEPALPGAGRGWLATESDGCRLEIHSWSGRWEYRKDESPPRFIETPSIASWCAGSNAGIERLRLKAEVQEGGLIVGPWIDSPGGRVPPDLASDIDDWLIESARDAEGNEKRVKMTIEVVRGLPQPERSVECE